MSFVDKTFLFLAARDIDGNSFTVPAVTSASMSSKLSQHWRAFRQSAPGERFQRRHMRHREAARTRSPLVRFGFLVLGGLSAAFGFILLFIPGPGLLFIAVGGGLVANESLVAARSFDWLELKSRAGIAKLKTWWSRRRSGG